MSARFALTLLVLLVAAAGCGDDESDAGVDRGGDADRGFSVRGSPALAPPAKTAANGVENRFGITVNVDADGTADAFDAFCTRGASVVLADRRIGEDEIATCRRNRVGFVRVAAGHEAVAVHAPAGFGAACLELGDVRRAFAAGATVDRYDRLDPRLPSRPLRTVGPVAELSTTELFVETGLDGGAVSREVATAADPEAFARAIEERFALGYFGAGLDRLLDDPPRSLAIDAGDGCVGLTPANVRTGAYVLSRPLHVYASEPALAELPVRTLIVDMLRRSAATLTPGLVPLDEVAAERSIAAIIGAGRGAP